MLDRQKPGDCYVVMNSRETRQWDCVFSSNIQHLWGELRESGSLGLS